MRPSLSRTEFQNTDEAKSKPWQKRIEALAEGLQAMSAQLHTSTTKGMGSG